jgi:hypothetical protein
LRRSRVSGLSSMLVPASWLCTEYSRRYTATCIFAHWRAAQRCPSLAVKHTYREERP